MDTNKASYLLKKYFNDEATHTEREALFKALEDNKDNEQWHALMTAFISAHPSDKTDEVKYEQMLRSIIQSGHKRRTRRLYYYLSAAASVVLILFAGYYFFNVQKKVAPAISIQEAPRQDIAPGGNKAILTLADGTKVILDSAGNGTIALQGATKIEKSDNGLISYQSEGAMNKQPQYNEISTPRGGQYQIVLSDGTKVWLNAQSSLKYPTSFVGKERKIELAGEGYFEVAHRDNQPFVVSVNGMEVKVLGTHFNVNAYGDDADVKTTLLEGSVAVSFKNQRVTLKPGQQAQLELSNSQLSNSGYVDIDMAVAWKNGKLLFKEASIETIMKTAARWYNADVIYKGKVQATFSGGISRSDNISQLLKILEATDKVSFSVNNNRITVQPPNN